MEKEVFLKKLGKRIKQLRKEQNISQAELARRCFKDRQYIELIENSKVNPTVYTLHIIATALNIKIEEILKY